MTFRRDKLHVNFEPGVRPDEFSLPRAYTHTHSDLTGDIFLTIGMAVRQEQVSGWYTRWMRDEVLATWHESDTGYEVHVSCHVSGGFIFGTASLRYRIFQDAMTSVLQAFYYGDRLMYHISPHLLESRVMIRFNAKQQKFDVLEEWGSMSDYRLSDP